MNINTDIVYAHDLRETLGISANTLTMWLRQGRIPQPDVKITNRTRYWLRSSLVAAKVLPPIPQASESSQSA
jgi:predicted site-specific integrase-resolvase